MAENNLGYDVNTFKNTTVKITKNDTYNINFENDIANQVQYSVFKDDIIITVYQARNGNITTKPIGKLTLKNAVNANSINITNFNYNSLNLFNQIFPAVYKNNKYTGSSFKENVSSNQNNETFSLGKGEDNVTYDFTEYENHGKDIINLVKGEKLNLDFTDNGNLTYTYKKSGNDAVIATRKNINFTYNAKIICSVSKGTTYGYYTINAKMYQVDENNYEVSKKAYSIKFYTQDINAMNLTAGKTTTLYCQLHDTVETVYEEFQELVRQQAQFNTGDYVLYSTTENPAGNTAVITLKNYFTIQDAEAVSINDSADDFTDELQTFLNSSYDATDAEKASLKKRTIKDTFLDEEIKIGYGKGDAVSSLGGNDTIIVNSPQNQDIVSQNSITLKNGDKTVIFNGNFGNTKITMDRTATLDLSGVNGELIKNGNNLEIYQNYQNNKIDKITINNYFKNYDDYNIAFNNVQNLTEAFKNGNKRVLYDYSDRKDKKITASDLSDRIICSDKTQTVNALGGDNIIEFNEGVRNWCEVFAGSGNDKYVINSTYVLYDITDKGGNDTIIANNVDKSDVLFLFDVVKQGANPKKYDDMTSLHAFYKPNYFSGDIEEVAQGLTQGQFYNFLNIDNYFNNDGTAGSGFIETIKTGENGDNWNMTVNKFNEIRANVAAWLNQSAYDSSYEVLESGQYNDVLALLQIYDAENINA